ncbi:MAG: PaaI family thioesterase [Candidatus Acidiferrum sp.]
MTVEIQDLKKYEAILRSRANETGATALLGLSLMSLEKGHVVFSMRVKRRHKQFHGVVHGGVLATVADTVAAIAAYTTVPKGTEIATVELKINFLEPVPGGLIKAEGRVLRTGRNFVVTECEIFSEKGTLVAKALLTFGAARGHSISQKMTAR